MGELRDVGRRVAEERRKRGFTQEALAEQLECSVSFLRSVETRGANVTVRWLLQAAEALDVPLRSFFTAPRSRARSRPGRPPRRET